MDRLLCARSKLVALLIRLICNRFKGVNNVARIIRFGIILMVVFGLIWLLQLAGLDQGTAIMLISVTFVGLALLVERALRNKQSNNNERQ